MKQKRLHFDKSRKLINKRLVKTVFIWLGLALIFVLWVVGGAIGTDQLRYHFKTNVDFSGGYITYFKDYDFNQDGTSFRLPPNGDIRSSLPLMQHKLDPLNQKNFQYSYIGQHAASLEVPKNRFASLAELNLAVNKIGSLFILNDKNEDLLVEKNTKHKSDSPFQRKSINDYFTTTVKHTLNDPIQRKPIVAIGVTSKWSELVKDQKKLYMWNDIGLMLDQMRNDWQSNSRFQTIYRLFNSELIDIKQQYGDYPQLIEHVKSLFDFNSTVIGHHNMLEYYASLTSNFRQRKAVFSSLQWTQGDDEFYINPFATEVSKNEQPIVAFEPAVNKIYLKLTPDGQAHYNSFLVDAENLKQNSLPQVKSDFLQVLTTTQTQSIILAALLQSGVSNHVFRVYAYSEVPPAFSTPLLVTALLIIGVIMLGLALYLISYFRAMGGIMILGLWTTLALTLLFSSMIGLPFSPVSVVALLVVIGTVGSGLVLSVRRFQFERTKNNLADLVAFKIVVRQVLPYLLTGIFLFMVLALVFYWLTDDVVKAMATFAIINLAVAGCCWLGGSFLAFWLFLKSRICDRWRWIAPAQRSPLKLIGQKIVVWIKPYWQKWFVRKRHNRGAHGLVRHHHLTAHQPPAASLTAFDDPVLKRRRLGFRVQLKRSFVWINVLLIVVLTAVAGVLLATRLANFDRSLEKGTVFYFDSQIWANKDYQTEVNFIKRIANGQQRSGNPPAVHRFNLAKFHVVFRNGTATSTKFDNTPSPVIIISTNINTANQAQSLQEWLGYASLFQGPDVPYGITWDFIHPVQIIHQIVKIVTACLVGSVVVFVIIAIFYNWAYALATLTSGWIALLLLLGFITSGYFLIAVPTFAILIAVWWFALINNGFIMSRNQKNLRFYHLPEYKRFFQTHHEHSRVLKQLRHFKRFDRRLLLWQHVRLGRLTHPDWKRTQVRRLVYQKWLSDPTNPYFLQFQARHQYRSFKSRYRRFEHNHNFLNQVVNRTMKDLLTQFLSLTGFLVVVLVVLTIFSGAHGFVFLTSMIGIVLAVYCCFAFATLIWVRCQSQHSLFKVRVNAWLQRHRPSQEEQLVPGINDVKF